MGASKTFTLYSPVDEQRVDFVHRLAVAVEWFNIRYFRMMGDKIFVELDDEDSFRIDELIYYLDSDAEMKDICDTFYPARQKKGKGHGSLSIGEDKSILDMDFHSKTDMSEFLHRFAELQLAHGFKEMFAVKRGGMYTVVIVLDDAEWKYGESIEKYLRKGESFEDMCSEFYPTKTNDK